QQIDGVDTEVGGGEPAYGFGSELGIVVRGGAGLRVDGVITRVNAVAAQHQPTGAAGLGADLAQHGFHVVIGNGLAGQKGGQALNIYGLSHGSNCCMRSSPLPEGFAYCSRTAAPISGRRRRASARMASDKGTMVMIMV